MSDLAEQVTHLVRIMGAAGIEPDKIGRAVVYLCDNYRPVVRGTRGPRPEYVPRSMSVHGYTGPVVPRLSDKEWWPLRAEILERDGHTCVYCGDDESTVLMCVDHVTPLSRGGSNHPDNLVACCMPCNSSKNDKLLSEWEGRRYAGQRKYSA